jgi:hypothetical protein
MEHVAPYIVPALALITAIILIVAGGKLLKPAIGLSAGLFGAGMGLMVAPALPIEISPFIIALVFGLLAAVMAIFLAKFAILFILSCTFASALPVATWQLAGLDDGEQVLHDVVEAVQTPDTQEADDTSVDLKSLSATQDAMAVAFAILTSDASKAIRSGAKRAISAWNAVPVGPRFMLIGAAIAGLFLGLLITTFMPFLAAAIVTSAGGSILLVESVRNFIALIWSQQTMASISSSVLFFTIIGIAVAGIGLQLTLAKRIPKATEK